MGSWIIREIINQLKSSGKYNEMERRLERLENIDLRLSRLERARAQSVALSRRRQRDRHTARYQDVLRKRKMRGRQAMTTIQMDGVGRESGDARSNYAYHLWHRY